MEFTTGAWLLMSAFTMPDKVLLHLCSFFKDLHVWARASLAISLSLSHALSLSLCQPVFRATVKCDAKVTATIAKVTKSRLHNPHSPRSTNHYRLQLQSNLSFIMLPSIIPQRQRKGEVLERNLPETEMKRQVKSAIKMISLPLCLPNILSFCRYANYLLTIKISELNHNVIFNFKRLFVFNFSFFLLFERETQ